MGKGAPKVPDAAKVSADQTKSNIETAQATMKMNAPLGNVTSLYGSNKVLTDANGMPIGQEQSIAPWLEDLARGQGKFGSSVQGLSQNMLAGLPTGIPIAPTTATGGDIARNAFGAGITNPNNMPQYWNSSAPGFQKTAFDPSQTFSEATNMAWKGAMAQLQPEFDKQQKAFDLQMSNRGLPVGSEAYNDANRARIQAQDNAMATAAANAQQTGYNQALQAANFNAGQNQAAFGNELAGLGYNRDTASTLFGQNLQAQGFGQNAAQNQFNNDLLAGNTQYDRLSRVYSMDPTNSMLSRAPGAANMQGASVANTDVAGNVWNAYNAKNAAQQQKMQGIGNLVNMAGTIAAPFTGGLSMLAAQGATGAMGL